MTTSRRTSVIVAIVAMGALLMGAVGLAFTMLPASSGARLAGPNEGLRADGGEVSPIPGAVTPFRAGDVVTSIAGYDLVSLAHQDEAASRAMDIGDVVPATILRDGQELALTVELQPYPIVEALSANVGTLLFSTLVIVLAAFVFWKRPRDAAAAGLLLLAVGAAASTPTYLSGIDPLAFARWSVPVPLLAIAGVYYLIFPGGIHFAMTFPRPHPAVQRRPALLLVPYAATFAALTLAVPVAVMTSPGGLSTLARFNLLGGLVVLVALVIQIALIVSAWRRSSGEDRRMIRGVVVTSGFTVVAIMLIAFIPEVVTGAPLVPWSVAAVVGLPMIVALAAAVLRDHAFDIDVVVNRSLVYGGLTLTVLGVYVVAVALLGAVLIDSADYAVALVATALAALAALPARDILQRTVERALYGDRDEPVRAIRRLGARLTWTMDPAAVPDVVVTTVADSLRLPYVALEIGGPDGYYRAAERGQARGSLDEVIRIPLVSRSVVVGRLVLSPRAPGEPLSEADRRLLEDLARQAGPAVDTLALYEALRRSRERIVLAGEEERRRLRHDLHDGLGPALAAIGMRAEAASQLVGTAPAAATAMLGEVRDDVQAAVADVRRLVDGLRPPALDELGLVGAIEQQAVRLGVTAPTFVVDSPRPLGELPAAVEVAAYRIAMEAMTNVVRHSGARLCHIRLATEPGSAQRLTLEVRDDGSGLQPASSAGVGLASMRQRAEEVGGGVQVEGLGGGGTLVRAWLPLGSAAAT